MDDKSNEILDAQQAEKAAAPQPAQTAEPMTRFCPGCGSVGEVDYTKHRDCCPDGGKARVIPEALALHCRDLFQAALSSVLTAQTEPVMANGLTEEETSATASVLGLSSKPVQGGEPVAWIRYEWNKSGSKSLVFEKPAEPSLADEARGVVYEPLYEALSSAPAQPVREPMWQPIETAPKDGSKLLLWWNGAATFAGWLDNSKCKYPWAGWQTPSLTPRPSGEPTHWMPLPAAPGATAEPAPVREPMSEEQIEPIFRARKAAPAEGIKDEWYWYAWGVADGERHHGITKE